MTTLIASVATNRPDQARVHLDFLDGLRGLAAVYVMLHHAWLTVWTDPAGFPHGPVGWLTTWLAFGHLSVTVFIVLSGFCLMLPVARSGGQLRGGVIRFFQRRAKRILPPYYFAILLCFILMSTLIGRLTGTLWDLSIPHGRHDWIKALGTHVLLVDDFFDSHKLNYVFWSVAVEWQIYFLFPILLILWRRLGGVATTTVALAITYCIDVKFAHTRVKLIYPYYVGLFAMGMLGAAVAFGPLSQKRFPWRGLGLFSAAALIAICCCGVARANILTPLLDFLSALGTTCLLVSVCRGTAPSAGRVLSAAPLVWIGTFSYSLYLIHAPLLQLIWQYFLLPLHPSPAATFAMLALAGGPLIIFASYLFYIPCERPFLNRRPPA